MANEFKVKKGLIVDGSGTVVDVQGTAGQLFSVTDSLQGDIFSVSDVSGIPILNVNSSGIVTVDGNIQLADEDKIEFGSSQDFSIRHTGANTFLRNETGTLVLKNIADDKGIAFQADDGSGGVATYFELEADQSTSSALYTTWGDNSIIALGDSRDLQIYHSGSHSYIKDAGTGSLYFNANGSDRFFIGSDVAVLGSTDFAIPQGRKLLLDGIGGHTYLEEESDSNLKFYVAGGERMNLTNAVLNLTVGISMTDSILINYTGSDGQNNDAGLKIMNDGNDWGAYIRKHSNGNFGLRIDSGGNNAISVYSTTGGSTKTFNLNGGTGDGVFAGNVALGDGTLQTYHANVTSVLAMDDQTSLFTRADQLFLANNCFYNSSDAGTAIEAGKTSLVQLDRDKIRFYFTASASAGGTVSFQEKFRLDDSGNADFQGNVILNSRLTFDHGGDHYLEAGTNSLAYKNASGTSAMILNASSGNADITGDVSAPRFQGKTYPYNTTVGHTANATTTFIVAGSSAQTSIELSGGDVNSNIVFKTPDSSNVERTALSLDTSQNANFANVALFNDNKGINFGNSNAKIYGSSADGIKFNAGGSEAMRLNQSGNLTLDPGTLISAGGTVLDIQGSEGQLFSVTNSLTGDLFSVSDVSGIPIFNVNSSGTSTFDGDVTIDGTATATSITTTGTLTAANFLLTGTDGFNLPSGGFVDWANGDARIVEGLVNNYSLSFQTYDGSALNTALRLDGNNGATFNGFVVTDGQVGVDTFSPYTGTMLHVSGATTAPNTSASNPTNTTALFSNQDVAYGTLFATHGSGIGEIMQRRTNTATYYDLHLQPHGGDAAGVGIGGSVDAGFKFQVNGTSKFNGIVGMGPTGIYTSGATAALNLPSYALAIKNNVSGSNNNWSYIRNTATGNQANLEFTSGVGIALTLNHDKSATFAGAVTATSFTGDGSNLTNLPAGSAPSNMVTTNTTQTISGSKTFTNTVAFNNTGSYNARFGYTSGSQGSQIESPSTGLHTFRCDSDKLRFWMGGTGGSQETLTIDQQGRIGIKKASPAYTLDVNGSVSNISIYASHDVAAYSDARVKTDVETIPDALEKVNKLRGVTFKRTDEGSSDKRMMGVIAQEVLDIIPEVVNKRESDGHYSVSYGNIVGVLIEAVKELTAEVEELKKQIK